MAYMHNSVLFPKPCANKAGEYVGNYRKGRQLPRNTRAGRPHPCKADTTTEMAAAGYVGLYLVADEPMPEGATEVPTPPELTEPKADTA